MVKLATTKGILLFLLFFPTLVFSQKKPLDHSVYDSWQSLNSQSIPYNGKTAIYNVTSQEGDGTLYLYDLKKDESIVIPRGSDAVISNDGKNAVLKISPTYSQTREAKIKKKKGPEMPQDTLAVIDLKSKEIKKYPNLNSFKYGKELKKFVVFMESEKKEESEKRDTTKTETPKEKTKKPDKDAGKPIYILNLLTGGVDTIKFVEKYTVSKDGSTLFYITKPEKKDSLAQKGLFRYNLESKQLSPILLGDKKAKFSLPSENEGLTSIAFYAQLDTAKSEEKFTNIYLYNMSVGKEPEVIVSNKTEGVPEGWMVSDKASLTFSKDGKRLFLGTKPIPAEKDTTAPDFERVNMNIWRWDADILPVEEDIRKSEIENKSYTALYTFSSPTKIIQLADKEIPNVNVGEYNIQDYILSVTSKPYMVMGQWESDSFYDLYKISLLTGERELLKKRVTGSLTGASKEGNYYLWYDNSDLNWYLYDLFSTEARNITKDLGVTFWDDETDTPQSPRPYSSPIWMENESAFILADKFDLWQFDPKGVKAPVMITEGKGREANRVFRVVSPLYDSEFPFSRGFFGGKVIKKNEPLYLSSFNKVTKETGYYIYDTTKKKGKLSKLVEGGFTYQLDGAFISSKTPLYLYTKSNFENSPNVFITADLFRTEKQLTNTNPQQSEYNWGSVELISWMTADSTPIKAEGLLFKPENFDATKKYPMIIYFYEKYSDELFRYRSPAPSRSTVNIPYFVSNEYIVFIPDIYFTIGHPGKSALNSILPALDMLCNNSWVDSENLAIQGQSWGGYLVSYMITQTDRFKAAGAGAPVANMTSAYGGIRWGSGKCRQFQYEHGQSRIGGSLWSDFDLYYENSPLFFVPNVKTPVLIMHNDQDDAVPWYQGIEFFTALRRLEKPAWMLQYKGELHNLSKRHNAKDLSVKLAEFFGYYLKGEPMPEWMKVE